MAAGNIVQQTYNFVGDIKVEFKKVSWTEKEELQAYTKIVVASTFAIGVCVFSADVFIQTTLESINILLGMLSG